AVDRGHGPQRTHELVGTAIAHHAHGLHRQKHGKRLPDGIVEPCLADLVEIDRVGRAQDLELLAGHGTWAADRKARARERMAPDEVVRQAEFLAEYADFVLEELAQRL